ncbi:MAG TPA: glycosyl hydrolase [Vicinamibacteria bacterium]|nr:glycosyl hydrolase [Vicinamibacteria bacterium]
MHPLKSLTVTVLAAFPWTQMVAAEPEPAIDPVFLESLEYRNIGPFRGGRVTAVAGVADEIHTFYMGSTGGGVWRTDDAGQTWRNLTDGQIAAGSIGAIAVAPSDANVVYVGTGSACPRGNISAGIGMYRSTDAGKSWTQIGLPEAGQIGKVLVHPKDPDLVYVAALGHIFGPNEDRGVYRSRDGGKNWEKVLYISEKTGANDLSMDPSNPRILYAGMWRAERKPFTMLSGDPVEGGLYKSTDGGDTWNELTEGLPKGPTGKIGVSVSPSNPDRVFTLIEAEPEEAGLYRSDDGGKSFRLINTDRSFVQRAWYYTHVFADPLDYNTVYVLNVLMHRSVDGGKSFETIRVPHGDTHDLWINPHDNQVMVYGDDGGAAVSLNAGGTWSPQSNQPTAEFYRVTTDHRFPYWVYGAQQDNTTVRIVSRTNGLGISTKDWHQVGGCESGHIAIDPRDPDANIVFAGCYGGSITRYDHRSGQVREITTAPQLALGRAAEDLDYRFQWNAPIRISKHDPRVLYHTSNYVHRSTDEGQTWRIVSPDLTVANPEMLQDAGGPITMDQTGVEVYATIFVFEESPLTPGELWAGTDDGRIHLTRDDGMTWSEITPPGVPEYGTVNAIDISTHQAGRATISVYNYRFDDFTPYVFRTNDYGSSWERIADGTRGIPEKHFVRVVREDPDRRGLLYAGTEYGMYVSFDDGRSWQSLQRNLPVTPVTDLQIKDQDLVLSTQGRSFWILDDLTPLHQLTEEVAQARYHLLKPRDAYRIRGGGFDIPAGPQGKNPPAGAVIYYTLSEDLPEDEELTLEILDASGEVVRTFSSKTPEKRARNLFAELFGFADAAKTPPAKKGLNRWTWDLGYPDGHAAPDTIMWGAITGPPAPPGRYQVRMAVSGWSATEAFEVRKDPRLEATEADLEEQFRLAVDVRDLFSESHDALIKTRSVRDQVEELVGRLKAAERAEGLDETATALTDALSSIEEKIYQTKNESMQDPLNFQPKLDNRIANLYGIILSAEAKPTAAAREHYESLKMELAGVQQELDAVLANELVRFQETVASKGVGPVIVPTP